MGGTRQGGLYTAQTVREKYGKNYYARIGAKGGRKSRGGGFASATPEQRREWGAKGGSISRRGKTVE